MSIQMLEGAVIFFVISLISGLFGFTDMAVGTASVARWLFFIAAAIFILFLGSRSHSGRGRFLTPAASA